MHLNTCRALLLCWIGCLVVPSVGQQTDNAANDEPAKIQAAIQSYVAAFNAQDAEKLAAHWSADGVYTSRGSGAQTVGRQAMIEEFKSIFAGENVPALAVATESIEFVSPNVALEQGVATVNYSDGEVVQSTYTVVFVKRDDSWLIDRVTEKQLVIESSHYDQLKNLDWLIGDWVEETENVRVEFACQWTANQNFISRRFKVFSDGEIESSGLQIIGWDAKEKKIRSWLFDSDGGVVNGEWFEKDGRWVVQSTVTLADGGSGSFTSVFQPLDDGSFEWKKINRVADGKILPNLDEIIIKRK